MLACNKLNRIISAYSLFDTESRSLKLNPFYVNFVSIKLENVFECLVDDQCEKINCVKSVQIRSFLWSVVSYIWTEYRKIRTRKTLHLDTFHVVNLSALIIDQTFKNIFQLYANKNLCNKFLSMTNKNLKSVHFYCDNNLLPINPTHNLLCQSQYETPEESVKSVQS